MKIANLFCRAIRGAQTHRVEVEVCISRGLPGFTIVGLPETAIKESKDRVRNAILNSDYDFPLKKITVNLAPAHLPKVGSHFDLSIAIGILLASDQLTPVSKITLFDFIGELALSGLLRPVQGIMPIALDIVREKSQLIFPADNAVEVALLRPQRAYAAQTLAQVCQHLNGSQLLEPIAHTELTTDRRQSPGLTLDDIKGQHTAKRALTICAAGLHSCLFIGPPGTGKSMLAKRLPGLLPALNYDQALESAMIQSLSHKGFSIADWQQRPFRAPHHSASTVAIIGGGGNPKPGEISLAHHGVLMLDEVPEFNRQVLEALREPLENGTITLSRAGKQAEYPARFQLIATMNPCPCGFAGDPQANCRCTLEQIQRYTNRISGPIRDRIDMLVPVPRLTTQEILLPATIETRKQKHLSHTKTRELVQAAYQRQLQRQGVPNSLLNTETTERYCALKDADRNFVCSSIDRLQLSTRSFHKILRLARTIADLAESSAITRVHLQEAFSLRRQV